jgi:hypothetical protein
MAPKTEDSNGIEVTNSSADDDNKKEEIPLKDRIKTQVTSFIASSRLFIYNKEQKTVFGNSSASWIKISIYYFLFYVCSGLFYCGMVAVFGAIISRESPRYWYHNSQLNVAGYFYTGLFQIKRYKKRNFLFIF